MTGLVIRRALLDYARRPLNVVLLFAVPVVIVVVWSGNLAEFSKLLGGNAKPAHLEAAAAGWAAALLAGLAGYFQVFSSRDADHRLASAGSRAGSVVAGRIGAAAALAMVASGGALAALAVRAGISDPIRTLLSILMVALIYLALGVLVGTLVRTEMNGALLITVVWMLDAFVGSGIGTHSTVTRIFPLHFPTLVLTGQASGHAGPIGDLGWSLVWALALSTLAVYRLASTTRPAHTVRSGSHIALAAQGAVGSPTTPGVAEAPHVPAFSMVEPEITEPAGESRSPLMSRHPRSRNHLVAALRAGIVEYRRNRVLWAMLVVVPIGFLALAASETPAKLGPVALVDGTRQFVGMLSMKQVHAAQMAAISAAFLAGITGLFVVTGSADGDQRLVLAGFRPWEVLVGRLGVIFGACVLTTAVAVGIAAFWLAPQQWAVFAGATLLIALTYAMVGVLLGPMTGRLGGLYLVLLLAFIDVGYGQTVMFHAVPASWGAFLPARGASKVLLGGAFTSNFGQVGYLLLGLGWLALLTVGATLAFGRRMGHQSKLRVPLRSRTTTPVGLSISSNLH